MKLRSQILLPANNHTRNATTRMVAGLRLVTCGQSFARLCFAVCCLATATTRAQEFLDAVDDRLFLATSNGWARVDLSGLFDLEGYWFDAPPPGLIFGGDDAFLNPRLSLFLDARAGKHLYSFVQARVDRGFDPRSKIRDARFDEYLLRYTPFDDARVNVQVGKFATVVGNWVARHDSWNNPFITAPLPYESIVTIGDQSALPGPAPFLARAGMPDKKDLWVSVLWGPSYASGASLFGTVEKLDYALEVKNAGLSSRPAVWDATDQDWRHPTVSGRIGFRPDASWNLGASFSVGAYLQPGVEDLAAFPAGKSLDDFKQMTFAHDLRYAHGHWQVWGEVFFSRFEVPNVGDADSVSYYLETKYKLGAQWFAALRWNQQLFGQVPDAMGGESAWDRDRWRMDAALGCRLTRHLQGKVQYSHNHQTGQQQQGERLLAVQATLRF